MYCKIKSRVEGDRLYLIDWPVMDALIPHNQETARDVKTVGDHYRSNWFDEWGFIVPVFHFLPEGNSQYDLLPSGGVSFINGRHRLEVLSKHINHIPMAVSFNQHLNRALLDKVVVRTIAEGEMFELPDLCVVSHT